MAAVSLGFSMELVGMDEGGFAYFAGDLTVLGLPELMYRSLNSPKRIVVDVKDERTLGGTADRDDDF